MRLRALRVHDLRQFAGRGVALEGITDGLNSFAEPNETGKSTLFAALRALLFFKETSKHKDIESLRPYDGGNPRIAADIETADGLYRVEKRFLGGPSFARIVDLGTGAEIARAGAAQDWIDRLTGSDDPASGPAGLLWVGQGQSSDLTAGRGARAHAMASVVEGQLDQMTGGERMRRMRDRVAEALDPFLTAGGGVRGGGPLGQSRHEAEALAAEEAVLAGQFTGLRADLDARRRLRRDLAREEGTMEEAGVRALALGKAREEQAGAEAVAASVPAAEAKVRMLTVELKAAVDALSAFEAARREAIDAKASLGDLEGGLPDLRTALASARGAEAEARGAADKAAEAVREARRIAELARRGARRDELTRRQNELSEARKAAAGAGAKAQEARAAAALITIDDAALRKLEDLERARSRADAALSGASTRLTMHYSSTSDARVLVDGAAMEPDEPLHLSHPARLTLWDLGELEIVPGGAEGIESGEKVLREASDKLITALEKHEVATMPEAREASARRTALKSDADRLSAIAAAHAPDGLESLDETLARLAAGIEEIASAAAPNPDEAEAALKVAEAAEREVAKALAREGAGREAAQSALTVAETRLAGLRQALDGALARSGPEAGWTERHAKLSSASARTREDLATARKAVEELAGAGQTLQLAQATVSRLEKVEANRAEMITVLGNELAGLDGKLSSRTADGIEEQLTEVQGQLNAAGRKLDNVELQFRALTRLRDALGAAHGQMREAYFEPVNAELRPLLHRVLGGEALGFDEESYAPNKLTREGREEDLDVLSGGTREQIAILTRLAFAKLLARRGAAPPVILDDALIFSDDDRIIEMFNVLEAQTAELQIIVFTCRQRAFAEMGGNRLRLTAWAPED